MRGVALLVLLMALLAALGCEAAMTQGPTAGPAATQVPTDGVAATRRPTVGPAAVVRIGGAASYEVDVAAAPAERRQGLSGRPYLAADAGMLFVFDDAQVRNFWMKEMRFPLDIIWIDGQCRLIGWAADVPTPPPGGGDDAIPRVQSPSPARYVLEVNAGEAARAGMAAGDLVEFLGTLAGRYGC